MLFHQIISKQESSLRSLIKSSEKVLFVQSVKGSSVASSNLLRSAVSCCFFKCADSEDLKTDSLRQESETESAV